MAAVSISLTKRIVQFLSNGSLDSEALLLYRQLHSHGLRGAVSFLPSLVKASASAPHHLHFALQLHCVLLKTGLASDLVITNSLITMYSKQSRVCCACKLFDTMPMRDSVTWHAMVSCYIGNQRFLESMDMYRRMFSAGFSPKPELTASVVSACGRAGKLSLGKAIHARCIVTKDVDFSVLLVTSLADMYSRCSDLASALTVFDRMPERNVVCWTAVISGSGSNGRYDISIELLRGMVMDGIKPNRATLVSVLPACGELGSLDHGKELHGYVFRHGFDSEPQVIGALIGMYGRSKGTLHLAMLLFERANTKDVVTWSSMMTLSNRHGDYFGTLRLFQAMQHDGVQANSVTLLALIGSCIGLTSTLLGRAVHGYALKCNLLSEICVENSLIDMYAKCGCPECSVRKFAEMQEKDLVTHSSMILSYGLQGHGYDALNLFTEMLHVGIQPDGITLLAVLSACNHSGLVDEGMRLFEIARRDYGTLLSLEHYACLLDLLGRSGRLEDACEVIRNMPMQPNPRILSSVVSACRSACRFEDAKKLALRLIDLEPENAANHTLLSSVCAEAGDWFQVEKIRRQMWMTRMNKISGNSRIQVL